ncbi:MAG: hypothetical protein KGH66_00025 [Candidatus Micrarchaeota archaeon]|nr:hypothetical protein [Candidatus Micrarchaeota archaeon]
MAIDPNDLIIFKVREQQKKRPVEKPAETKPEKKPEVKAVKKPEPKAVAEPVQKPERKPLFFNKQKEAPQEREPATPMQFAKPKQVEERPVERKQAYESYAPAEKTGEVYESDDQMQEALINKSAAQTRAEYMSREAVQNLHCTWHPWRKAYSRCNYCHRPFCFEDIAEYNGNYYCLEDVDKAPTYSEEKERYSTYNNLSTVAATLLLVMFAVFVIFANGQLAYIIGYANAVGIFAFLSNINYSYMAAIAQGVLAVFAVVAAMLLFLQSLRGYSVAIVTVFANVALASYQYLNSGTLYLALLAAIGFVAIVVLAYSRNNYESAPSAQLYPMEGQEFDINMPNVGQF